MLLLLLLLFLAADSVTAMEVIDHASCAGHSPVNMHVYEVVRVIRSVSICGN